MDRAERVAHEELLAAASQGVLAMQRLEAVTRARDDLLAFTCLTKPDPRAPHDWTRTGFTVKLHHRFLAETLTAVADGFENRVIITLPPRSGKSELGSRRFIPWSTGRRPDESTILGSYGQEFAEDFGRDVRDIMGTSLYKQIFPGVELKAGSRAADRLETVQGGEMFFVGRGSTITGRGGHRIIIDDPIKDAEEARSPTIRDKAWEWFVRVITYRLMDDKSAIIIIVTRWNEDDIVGRLTNPQNPCYNPDIAGLWKVINIPALAGDDDVLGRAPGEALWPERFSVSYLQTLRKLDPEGFSALWQGKPTPEEGTFFKRDSILPYVYHSMERVPSNLHLYGASDHATSLDTRNDKSCLGLAGVDPFGDIWILPDIFWQRATTGTIVESMLAFFRRRPLYWWAERDQIFKSIEPFLRVRMIETNTYASIHQLTSTKDKMARAQPINARMAMGKVHLPAFAPWFSAALDELLSFPNGIHDDFVDFMGCLGRGLALQVPAQAPVNDNESIPKPGTLGHLKWATANKGRDVEATRYGGF